MKHVQEGIFEDKDMSSVATKPRKVNGRKKTVKFSHITLVDGGTQAIPQYGMPDKTYENLYNLAFADSIIGIPQTFDCEDEKFTLLIHSKDQKHINISICNTKDFDEQLVRAVDKNSQKPVSSNLELKYYTFASINRKNNCIAYLFNKNIKDINKLLEQYFYNHLPCVVEPLLIRDIRKRLHSASDFGNLSMTLDNVANSKTNLTLNQALSWSQNLIFFKIDVRVHATREIVDAILSDKNLSLKASKTKLEYYPENSPQQQVVDLLKDYYSLTRHIPSNVIKMEDVDNIFEILKESFSDITEHEES